MIIYMNIIVVDDQPEVVESIQAGINWDKLEVEHFYAAYSAREAKNILSVQTIDIALLDIEMPGESGIALLQWIRERNLQVECVFLTCHAEFEYAQQALSLGSCDYVLQPAPMSAIEVALLKASRLSRQKRMVGAYQTLEKVQLSHLEGVLRAAYNHSVLDNGSLYTSLQAVFGNRYSDLFFCPAVIAFKQKQRRDMPCVQNIVQQMQEVIKQCRFTKGEIQTIEVPVNRDTILVFLCGEKTLFNESDINKIISVMHDVLQQIVQTRVMVGVGYIAQRGLYEQIHLLAELQECEWKNTSDFYVLPTPVQECEAVILQSLDVSFWTRWILDGEGNSILVQIERYIKTTKESMRFSLMTLKQIHYLFNKSFFFAVEQIGLSTKGLFDMEYTYERYTQSFDSYDELYAGIQHCIERFNMLAGMSAGDRLQIARQYIHDNFNKNITRAEVASQVYLSEEYFSRLFKKETGYGFKEYVLKEKIRYAKHLLESTSLSIGIIGSKIGYENFSYFSKIFGKEVGMTPQEYRRIYKR